MQWHLLHSQGYATFITVWLQNVFITLKGNPFPFKQSLPIPFPPPSSS